MKPVSLSITLLVFLSILINYSIAVDTYCKKTDYCMACDYPNSGKCLACFNWPGGSTLARVKNKSTSLCHSELKYGKVKDCKYYDGLTTNDTIYVRKIDTCKICNKDYLRWMNANKAAECTDWQPLNCLKVDNCLTTVCFDNTPTTTDFTYGCRMCDKGYVGGEFDTVQSAGSKICTEKTEITNCDYHIQTGASAWNCYACASSFAVASDQQSCVGFTTDSNCRRMRSGNAMCEWCWHSYYWDFKTCTLWSQIGIKNLSFVVLMLIVIMNFVW